MADALVSCAVKIPAEPSNHAAFDSVPVNHFTIFFPDGMKKPRTLLWVEREYAPDSASQVDALNALLASPKEASNE